MGSVPVVVFVFDFWQGDATNETDDPTRIPHTQSYRQPHDDAAGWRLVEDMGRADEVVGVSHAPSISSARRLSANW